jgi:pimeloyl-ACP methyl ester carboxylesterase
MIRVATRAGELAALAFGPERSELPLVVCLHGFPDTAASFTALAQLLGAGGRRVIAPFMRGYAPSPLEGPYSPDQLADDALALADALSPARPVVLVGHDWGAAAVYAACMRAPDRVARAVTLALPHPAAFVQNAPRAPLQLRRSWYMFFFQLPRVAEWALRRRDFALVARLWRDWSPGWEPPAAHLAVAGERFPTEPLRVPTLVLHGARDGCVAAALGDGQDRFFSGGYRREILPEVGHFLHLERPAAVAERVAAWLD